MASDIQAGTGSPEEFKQALAKLEGHPALNGLDLSVQQWEQLDKFCRFLAAYNEKVNLVSNTSAEILVGRHILDGLTVAANIYLSKMASGKRLIDIGSGGGLPAMVIAIACPELEVTMVDSVGKKVHFLAEAGAHLGLTTRALVARAEELARERDERASYDLATARAVGTLELTIELCLPFLKRNGIYLAQKTTGRLEQELKEAKAMMRELECRVEQTKTFAEMPGVEESVILVIRKIDTTPHYYPRPWAKIKASKN